MRDVDREESRGNTHLLLSSLFGLCARLLHLENYKCIIVREPRAGTVNRECQLAPLGDEMSTPSTPDLSFQTQFSYSLSLEFKCNSNRSVLSSIRLCFFARV